MPMPEESPGRSLLTALSAMAVVAVTVGLVAGGAVLAIGKYAGVDAAAQARGDRGDPSLFIPKYSPTKSAAEEPVKTYPGSPTPSVDLPSDGVSGSVAATIRLLLAPLQVAPGERINVNGTYAGGVEGAQLQIQRRSGGVWSDFPVSATVRAGSFGTWITTSQTGVADFRVVDVASGQTSNVVTITIG